MRAAGSRGAVVAALAVVACSAASIATVPNLAGVYDVVLVNGTNGCSLPGVPYGSVSSAVPITISQDPVLLQNMVGCMPLPLLTPAPAVTGTDAAVLASDAADAAAPDVVATDAPADACATSDAACPCGTVALGGTLGGTVVTLTATSGDASAMLGDCGYTTNAALALSFSGNTVQGTLTYTVSDNGGGACATIAGCQTVQSVSGVLANPTLTTAPPCDAGCDAAAE